MDSRNRGKCHHFPQPSSGRVRVLVAARSLSPLYGGNRCSAPVETGISAEFSRDELTLYSRENIQDCCRLLLRRSREEAERW
jgi:hypothetical protein